MIPLAICAGSRQFQRQKKDKSIKNGKRKQKNTNSKKVLFIF